LTICNRCFIDKKIRAYIKKHGTRVASGYICPNCSATSKVTHSINPMTLSKKLQRVILKFYAHEHVHGLFGSARSNCDDGEYPASFARLSNLNDVCFDLFDDDSDRLSQFIVDHRNLRAEMDGGDTFFDSTYDDVWKENCWFDMSENEWYDFSENVKHNARFFDHSTYSRTQFLKNLFPTFKILLIKAYPSTFYRARIVDSIPTKVKISSNPLEQLDKPLNRIAGYNRFSPAGISYIYLADTIDTALAEVRSTVGQECAYGEFELESGLKIIDLRKRNLLNHLDYFDDDFSSSTYCFLSAFTINIAQPIAEHDKLIDYVPTQIVSEFLWSKGFDGFLYDSNLSRSGYNLVVFNNHYELRRYGFVENLSIQYRVTSTHEI